MQEAVKARSLRNVIPQNENYTVRPRKMVSNWPGMAVTEKHSNYEGAFNDARWPDMWYFVSGKCF